MSIEWHEYNCFIHATTVVNDVGDVVQVPAGFCQPKAEFERTAAALRRAMQRADDECMTVYLADTDVHVGHFARIGPKGTGEFIWLPRIED